MFAVLPNTPFTFGTGPGATSHAQQQQQATVPTTPSAAATPNAAATASSSSSSYFYRPAVSSPLSSSPIRASSTSPPNAAGAGAGASTYFRDIQSSPIPAQPKFKYASRPARPNPAVPPRREVAQESRRKLFLKNVRQRAEDQRWERRGGDQELFKLEWLSFRRDQQARKESDLEGFVSEAEIEDAARLIAERSRLPTGMGRTSDPDDMLVDALAQEEAAEIEALFSSMQTDEPSQQDGTRSPQLSDDEDYDAIFEELLSRGQELRVDSSGDTEMT